MIFLKNFLVTKMRHKMRHNMSLYREIRKLYMAFVNIPVSF